MEAGTNEAPPACIPAQSRGHLSPLYRREETGQTSASSSSQSLSLSMSANSQSPTADCPRSLSFEDDSPRHLHGVTSPRQCTCSKRAFSLRGFARPRTTDSDESTLGSNFDDDLDDRNTRPCWRTLHAVMMLTYSARKPRPNGKFSPLAGHSDNFRTEDGYVLKALTLNEASTMESLQRERALKPFAPQFMGCVERDGRTFIKMQDVLLSMSQPNVMDVKMGLRTFAESEVQSDKRRMDLLKKALLIQQKNPSVYISDDEKENGISKHRFMSLRDHASSSATLGFRVQGMLKDQKSMNSKDFSAHRSAIVCRSLFRSFFERASPQQRTGLLQRMKDLHAAAANSEWFAAHEVIGSSLLIGYDTLNPDKFGIWMIDFARTEPCPTRLTHTRPWTMGSREDGYLLGIQSLIRLWSDEFCGDLPLEAKDWHYRAEGHNCIVVGYHGHEPALHGKVLRLAKQVATARHRDTLAGHPATAYHDFVSTMLVDYIGPAADPGRVVYVPRPFLESMAAKMTGRRPAYRVEQCGLDLESEYQLLLDDASYVPGAKHQETIAVELKLKMGYLPPPTTTTHWVKSLVSRFAMQQYCKLHEGVSGKISEYCPLDLFSGDFDRTQNVILRLLDSPQNNIRVFLGDASVVPQQEGRASSLQSGKQVLDTQLAVLLGTHDLTPSQYLSELVAKSLVQPCPVSGITLMKKIQNLQRVGLDIETIWPHLQESVRELQQIYHVDPIDVGAVVRALPPYPAVYCHSKQQRLRRGLRTSSLASLAAVYYAAKVEREAEVRALEARLREFDGVTEMRKFLLSQSLKACSLMVALAEVPHSHESLEENDIIQGSDGRLWRYSMRLLDLDAKTAEQLSRWYEMDQTIVSTYLREAFGTDDVELPPEPSKPSQGKQEGSLNIVPTALDTEEVDRILGLTDSDRSSSPNSVDWEVEEMLRYPDRLPSLTDQQIEELLGLCSAPICNGTHV